MIPDIHAIVEMLIAGQCTAQQAIGWLNTHMENAELRDHFAANAVAGWLASYGCDNPHPANTGHADVVAVNAYAMADAMLKARSA